MAKTRFRLAEDIVESYVARYIRLAGNALNLETTKYDSAYQYLEEDGRPIRQELLYEYTGNAYPNLFAAQQNLIENAGFTAKAALEAALYDAVADTLGVTGTLESDPSGLGVETRYRLDDTIPLSATIRYIRISIMTLNAETNTYDLSYFCVEAQGNSNFLQENIHSFDSVDYDALMVRQEEIIEAGLQTAEIAFEQACYEQLTRELGLEGTLEGI